MNPMEQFEVKPLIQHPLFQIAGHDVFFTNQSLFMIVVVLAAALFMTLAMSKRALVPSRSQSMAELSYEFVANMIHSATGEDGLRFFSFVFTLFVFVLFCNFDDRHAVWQALLDRGVLIRETGPDTWLRVSIGTPDEMRAFKAALLAAKTVGYSQGPSGVHFMTVLARLGITDQVKAKGVVPPLGQRVGTLIAEGKADMVALARGFLDDPRWGWHAADHLRAEVFCPPQYRRARPPIWTPPGHG